MQRKYRTTHQGIAAYLVTQGIDVERLEEGKNREGKPCVFIEFNVDWQIGKEMGDAFYNGNVNGNLKDYHTALGKVRQKLYEARK